MNCKNGMKRKDTKILRIQGKLKNFYILGIIDPILMIQDLVAQITASAVSQVQTMAVVTVLTQEDLTQVDTTPTET